MKKRTGAGMHPEKKALRAGWKARRAADRQAYTKVGRLEDRQGRR